MTRTGQAAIDYARSRVGGSMPDTGRCLQFVRECFAVSSYYYSAIDAWNGCQRKHPGDRNPPPAVPAWFATPSQYDHVVFMVSTTEVISTWGAGIARFSGISDIERQFNGQYLGWGEDINRVNIYPYDNVAPILPPTANEDDEMMIIQSPSRGLAVVMGSRVVSLGDGSTADAMTSVGVPRCQISDGDFDRMRYSGTDPVLIVEASRGYALLSGAQATPLGDMATVEAFRGAGATTISVTAADFDYLASNVTGKGVNVTINEGDLEQGRHRHHHDDNEE